MSIVCVCVCVCVCVWYCLFRLDIETGYNVYNVCVCVCVCVVLLV